MADFFKGLAGGMQTGLQFGEAIRKRRMEDELAQAYARPETSQGYTAETGQQLEELAKSGAYDIVPQYAPAAEGQTQGVFTGYQAVPKAGLDLQGDVPAAPMAFNPQQVQDYGGRRVAGQFDPTQLRGLQMQEAARVLGSYGDVRGAAALETQADELRRGLARDKRDEAAEARRVAREPLEIKQLENALVSQGLTIAEAQRVAAEQVSISSAREKLQTLRKDGPLTAAIISNVAGEFKLDPTKFLQAEDAVNTLEIKDLKRNLSSAALKGEDGLNKFLADKFDPDKTDNIKPMITKAKDGSFVVTYGDRVLQEYGAHKNMMSLVGGVINMIDQNPFATLTTLSTLETQAQARKASEAAVRASDSTVSYNAARTSQINQMNNALATNLKNSEEAKQIQTQFAMLDDTNDPGGAKRQSLITQFNMLSVKAGGTIPTTGGGKKGSVLETPVEQKKNDDGTYTAFSKDGGKPLYTTYNGEAIPLGMEVGEYKAMKDAAKKNGVPLITGEDNGRLVLKFAGPDGKYYDDAEKAKYAKPAKADGKPGGLDTSRTTVVQPAAEPTAPTPKPVRAPGESFTEFRDRTVAWDRNRIAYEQMLTEQRLRGQLSGNAAGLRRPLVDQPVR